MMMSMLRKRVTAVRLVRGFKTLTSGEPLTVRSISVDAIGDPAKVLKIKTRTIPNAQESLGKKDVIVKMLASSLNPADFNMIEGTYGVKVAAPFTGGSEGVGVVVAAGASSPHVPGSWVIPVIPGLGTWSSHVIAPADAWYPIPSDFPITDGATLMVNPCTAYRMLSDFVDLKRGDVVVQNGATSGVGTAAIQIAAARGIKTINVVRDRPNMEETRTWLTSLGATVVIDQSTLDDPEKLKTALEEAGLPASPKAKLGLNCVGGKATSSLLKVLGPSSTVVTYGGMSRQPITIGVGPFIFQDISLRGFWMTRWGKAHGRYDPEREKMMQDLVGLVLMGRLKTNAHVTKVRDEADLAKALELAQTPHKNVKSLITLNTDDDDGNMQDARA